MSHSLTVLQLSLHSFSFYVLLAVPPLLFYLPHAVGSSMSSLVFLPCNSSIHICGLLWLILCILQFGNVNRFTASGDNDKMSGCDCVLVCLYIQLSAAYSRFSGYCISFPHSIICFHIPTSLSVPPTPTKKR